MLHCQNCDREMSTEPTAGVHSWRCPRCTRAAVLLNVFKRDLAAQRRATERVTEIWQRGRRSEVESEEVCPACAKGMKLSSFETENSRRVDVCIDCRLLVLNETDLASLVESIPAAPPPPKPYEGLPEDLRVRLALIDGQAKVDDMRRRRESQYVPETPWQWIVSFLGLPWIADPDDSATHPVATYIIAAVVLLVGLLTVFVEPAAQLLRVDPVDPSPLGPLAYLTSFFISTSVLGALASSYLILIFGARIEVEVGWHLLLVLLGGGQVLSGALQALNVYPLFIEFQRPASALIALSFYYVLRWPGARLAFSVFLYGMPRVFRVPVWLLFALWMLLRLLSNAAKVSFLGWTCFAPDAGGALAAVLALLLFRHPKGQKPGKTQAGLRE